MDQTDPLRVFLERVIGRSLDGMRPHFLTGWQVIESLWPLVEQLQPLHARLESLAYDAAFEPQADAALEALATNPAAAWADLPSDVLRVLSERVQQGITVAGLNGEARNTQFMAIPPGLTAQQTTVAAALSLLHRMKLPWPPGHQSGFSHPPGSAKAPLRRQ